VKQYGKYIPKTKYLFNEAVNSDPTFMYNDPYRNNQSVTYRGFISATNSDMVESLPNESENPRGRSDVAAPYVTPLGHSLVVND
jgi:hypothetical protein